MTTVTVTKDYMMADSQVSDHSVAGDKFPKLRKFQDAYYAATGSAGIIGKVLYALQAGERVIDVPRWDEVLLNFSSMPACLTDEKILIEEGDLIQVTAETIYQNPDAAKITITSLPVEEMWSMGSGTTYARAGWVTYGDQYEAMLLAAKQDFYTNDNIRILDRKANVMITKEEYLRRKKKVA
jgi:hypothetical protein